MNSWTFRANIVALCNDIVSMSSSSRHHRYGGIDGCLLVEPPALIIEWWNWGWGINVWRIGLSEHTKEEEASSLRHKYIIQ